MWLGEVEAPAHPHLGAASVYKPVGQVPAVLGGCRRQHQAGLVEGARGRGAEKQLLNTLPLELANSLAWQKLLENCWKMKCGCLFQRWGGEGVAETDMVFAWNSHSPCGLGAPQGQSEGR